MKTPLIAPSLLAANFLDLRGEIEWLNSSSADWLHLDIMDGMFVPNISFGFPVISQVGKICAKPLDVHLMVERPERYISEVRDSGAMMMNVHQEATLHLHRTIYEIRKAGMKAAVTLNPSTPVSMVEDVLADVDMVLLMSVNPGFGGQSFIERTYDKTRALRRMIDERGLGCLIEIDGGVNQETAPRLVEAGADVLVAGSYVFGSKDRDRAVGILKGEK